MSTSDDDRAERVAASRGYLREQAGGCDLVAELIDGRREAARAELGEPDTRTTRPAARRRGRRRRQRV